MIYQFEFAVDDRYLEYNSAYSIKLERILQNTKNNIWKQLLKESMKAAHSDFRVPLTDTLFKILEYFKQFSRDKEYVFISSKTNKPISENFLPYQYKKLGYQGIHTPHGWRSSFRTIAAEKYKEHKFPFDVIESQLHHKIGNKVTQAYLRTDFLDERRELLKWWEEFLIDVV